MRSDKRVLVLVKSGFYSGLICRGINRIGGFTSVPAPEDTADIESAVKCADAELAVIDIDCGISEPAGLIEKLVCRYKIPIVVCTASRRLASCSLSAGAADFVIKNVSGGSSQVGDFYSALSNSVQNAANLREVISNGRKVTLRRGSDSRIGRPGGILLIGGSTGSTEALVSILKDFPPDCPPTAASLHMPEGYTALYAKRLNALLPQEVLEAADGLEMKRGRVIIAKGGCHMKVFAAGYDCYVRVEAGERISGHCPSVDVLFDSGASVSQSGIRICAAILTGMGSDGAKGLLKLRKSGAFTVGQDEKSSVVYGMPKAAYEIGAVCMQCGVNEIAARLLLASDNRGV